MSNSYLDIFNDLVAGAVGGALGVVAGAPADVLKTRQQTYGGTMFGVAKNIVQKEGVGTFYRGIIPPIIGNIPLNALTFASYGFAARKLEEYYPQTPLLPHQLPKPNAEQTQKMYEQLKTSGTAPTTLSVQDFHNANGIVYDYKTVPIPNYTNVFFAGCFSGLVSCLVLTPVELVKIKEQNYDGKPPGSLQIMRDIFRIGGIRGLYQGTWATIWREAPSLGVWFGVYEACKHWMRSENWTSKWNQEKNNIEVQYDVSYGVPALLAAGSAAGVTSWISTYPFDYAKTTIQNMPYQQYLKEGKIKTVFAKAVKQGGQKALWVGLGAAIVRAIPVNSVTFLFYEKTLQLLKSLQHDRAGQVCATANML